MMKEIMLMTAVMVCCLVVGCAKREPEVEPTKPTEAGKTAPSEPTPPEPETEPATQETEPETVAEAEPAAEPAPVAEPEQPEEPQQPPPAEAEAAALEPEDFAAFRLGVEGLEAKAQFNEALRLCREMSEKFTAPEQEAFLREALARLRQERQVAIELSFGVESLETTAPEARKVIWNKLINAEDVGRIYLRKIVRESTPEVVLEAAKILINLGDEQAVALTFAQLEKAPESELGGQLIGILAKQQEARGWESLARICELSAESGPNQAAMVDLVLDAVTAPVMTVVEPEEGKEPGPPEPALEKLATTTRTELQPKVATAVLLLVEKYPPPQDPAALDDTSAAVKTAARGLHVLRGSGYRAIPKIVLDRLRQLPSAEATGHLIKLMQSTIEGFTTEQLDAIAEIAAEDTPVQASLIESLQQEAPRLDEDALNNLCAVAQRGGANHVAAGRLVIEALIARITPPAKDPKAADAQVPPAEFAKLSSLISGELQQAVTVALLKLLETAAAPRAEGDAATLPEEVASQARAILLESGFPHVAPALVARLQQQPPQPVAAMLAELLGAVPGQIDAELIDVLCTESVQEGPDSQLLLGRAVDALAWSAGGGRPVEGKPDERTEPTWNKLAELNEPALHKKVVDASLAFLAERVAPAEGAAKTDAEGEALATRLKAMLTESGYPELAPALVARLQQQPPQPVAAMLAELLGAVPEQIDAEQLAGLCGMSKAAGDAQAPILGAVVNALEWSVGGGQPVANKPNEKTTPTLEKLAEVTPEQVEQAAAGALIFFVATEAQKQGDAAKPNAALVERSRKLLVESGYASVPGELVATLKSEPEPPVVTCMAEMLKQLSPRLTPEQLSDILALAVKKGPSREVLVDLLTTALEPK